MIIQLILGLFGYAKVPVEAVRLAMWIKEEAGKKQPDMARIQEAAAALEQLFRSARKAAL